MLFMRILVMAFLLMSISACTTQKALNETGKEIDKGNYGVAAWYTLTLPIAMIYDVFTLGGTSDVSSGTSALSSAVSTVSPGSDAANTLSAMASSSALANSTTHASGDAQVSQIAQTSQVSTGESTSNLPFKPADYMPDEGRCEKNLAYLSDRLPTSSITLISDTRSEILKSDMHSMMLEINKEGLSPDQAIDQSLQQAQEYDRVMNEALHSAAQTDGQGITEAQFASQIKSGSLQISECDGVRNASLCAAIVNHYGAISSRGVAANLTCYKNTHQWPKA